MMKKNALKGILPAILLSLILAACGTTNSGAPSEKPAAPDPETAAEAATAAAAATAEKPAASDTETAADAATAVAAATGTETTEAEETTAEETADKETAEAEASSSAATAATTGTAATAAEDTVTFQSGKYTLAVPAEYVDLLNIQTLHNDPDGILFKVFEKESVEAAKARGEKGEGAGWLFNIGILDEQGAREMLCEYMTGRYLFAKSEDGTWFVKYHPTDVRLVREGEDQYNDEAMAQWAMLGQWANEVPNNFIRMNEGLTPEKHSNTDLDIHLARIAYRDNVNYTISTLENGVMEPGDTDPSPYLSRLMNGVTIDYARDEEFPDGEYLVLDFPDDHVRFEFFFMEGKQNLFREVLGSDENEENRFKTLYRISFEDETASATEIMNEWYHALVDHAD